MTLKLNRSRPYGKITPPWDDRQFDTPAHYEQDGNYFDAHFMQLIPGGNPKPVAPTAPAPVTTSSVVVVQQPVAPPPSAVVKEPTPTTIKEPERIDVSALLAQADTMPWAKFRGQAKKVLGPTCPPDKEGMKHALATAIAAVQEREEKRAPGKAAQPAAVTVGAPTSPAATGGVDLAAWGMGQTEYLFGEVQKAIRTTYSKQVSERRDAVDFLIEQHVITAATARTDV